MSIGRILFVEQVADSVLLDPRGLFAVVVSGLASSLGLALAWCHSQTRTPGGGPRDSDTGAMTAGAWRRT